MAYYGAEGDYYAAGDYYEGDPIFGALISGIGAVGKVGKVAAKGARAAARAVGIGKKGASAATTAASVSGGVVGAAMAARTVKDAPPGMKKKKGIKAAIERAVPGGETGYVKTRRMNPTNVRALRRALRRAERFERLARRVGRFTRPGQTYRLKIRRGAARRGRK